MTDELWKYEIQQLYGLCWNADTINYTISLELMYKVNNTATLTQHYNNSGLIAKV